MTRHPPLAPMLDLERHAPRALLLGLLLAGALHATAVAYGKLMPPLPKPKAAPRVVRPIDVELVESPAPPPDPGPIALDETTIEAPAPVRARVLAPKPRAPASPPPQMMRQPEPEPIPVTTAPPLPVAAYLPPPIPLGPDRSSPARLGGSVTWKCPWPKEADPEMHHVQVRAQADVRADGSASAIAILDDPGYGFGREARLCALRHTFVPAHGRDGTPTAGPSLPFFVHFDKY
jgi:hypothetical protein